MTLDGQGSYGAYMILDSVCQWPVNVELTRQIERHKKNEVALHG